MNCEEDLLLSRVKYCSRKISQLKRILQFNVLSLRIAPFARNRVNDRWHRLTIWACSLNVGGLKLNWESMVSAS